MNSTISELPMFWKLTALGLLALGIVFAFGFLGRYMRRLPWASTQEGRHLVAMSATIGGFLVLYAVLAAWPDMPYRHVVRLILFAVLVGNLGWRWWLLEKHLRERDRARRDADRV